MSHDSDKTASDKTGAIHHTLKVTENRSVNFQLIAV